MTYNSITVILELKSQQSYIIYILNVIFSYVKKRG